MAVQSASQPLAYISHSDCQAHDMGPGHPESPARLRAIEARLAEAGFLGHLHRITARPVSLPALLAVHSQAHVRHIETTAPETGIAFVDPDTGMNAHSLRAAQLAAGAVEQAVEDILAGRYQRAFCAVRPPGHHAERSIAMGFCLFNNIAVGVETARRRGLKKVAVLDFDVHHGNGTVDIFKDEPDVLVCSSFQHPFYPGRYWDIVRPNIVNSPLRAGSGGAEFRGAVEQQWLPALDRHQPEMIFVSAGFDAHRDDPLANLKLVEDDYRWAGEQIRVAAERYGQGRVVAALEGGYNLEALAASCEAFIATLLD